MDKKLKTRFIIFFVLFIIMFLIDLIAAILDFITNDIGRGVASVLLTIISGVCLFLLTKRYIAEKHNEQ